MNPLEKNRNAKMFIWNTAGIMCNAGTAFLLLIFVTRICGDVNAGIFALGFSNAQLMLSIGRFGMRAYQATDVKGKVRFSTYLLSRIITCFFMLLVSILYIVYSGYTFYKAAVVFSVCIIKMADALEDVFHGLFQQNGRIDLAGQLLTARNVITMVSFIVILITTRDLLITCILTGIISIAACIVMNLPMTRHLAIERFTLNKQELIKLFISCFPLFIGSFLSLYIYNVPKYTIDRYLTEEYQTYYNILFMPTFAINLISEFIFKPLLTDIAIWWNQENIKKFISYIIRLFAGIALLTVFVLGFGYFFGNTLLSFVYGVDLMQYRQELVLLLIGGGFGAGVYLLFNVLTAMRLQVSLLVGYTASALFITVICPVLVKNSNLMGASITCLLSTILLFIIFSITLISAIIRKNLKTNYINQNY